MTHHLLRLMLRNMQPHAVDRQMLLAMASLSATGVVTWFQFLEQLKRPTCHHMPLAGAHLVASCDTSITCFPLTVPLLL
jgi:hypothetical protein